ncbi:MAG: glycoside hydrolase family 2 [Calditrichaeota bacterium]|nr:MAG: glycoside hydrolase family 2 [Calditrichota bacterium]
MRKPILLFIAIFLIFTGLCNPVFGSENEKSDIGPLDWPEPQIENRPGTYWWWMGSAVDEKNITWNLETMHKAGMGGATIVPIYGVKGYEDRYIQHLSPKWVEMLQHAVKEAQRLDMWVDMTTGTGWPFGGPMISESNCDLTVFLNDGTLATKFSGRNVKRAAPGGEGMAINPYSSSAMATYLRHFDEAFAKQNLVLPRAMYHDSFEFKGNWRVEFPEEFKRRRGYDLLSHVPALFGDGNPETVARIKSDYRETLSDLHLEYMQTWVKWAERWGCTTRNQAHGAPANLLDLYAASGIPETETFGATPFKIPGIRRDSTNIRSDFPQPLINSMASSAAHVAGKNLIAAETCTWVRNHFHSTLSQIKPEIDQLFLNGINHIFFHGTAYSPADAPWPGWLFYASLEYNPRNAIWHDAPFLNDYITRCQSILQSGKPDNQVALYWPIYDLWHAVDGMQQQLTVHHPEWLTESACGKTAADFKKNGIAFDFISDRQLIAGMAKSYPAIVVPSTKYIPLATIEKLLAIADTRQIVIFLDSLLADVPGYFKAKQCRAELKKLYFERKPTVVESKNLHKYLAAADVIIEPMKMAGLDFIRRKHEEGYHYFIANMSAEAVDGWITLGVQLKNAVILNPLSAETGIASQRGANEIYLQLLPGETRVIRTFTNQQVDGKPWPSLSKSTDTSIEITGNWQVDFLEGGPKIPAPFKTNELKSWTELGDTKAQRFAGTARYAIDFDMPATKNDDWIIDLGEVRESARVILNGKNVAALWSIPYRAPLRGHLKLGKNRLEIEVTNLSANRIRDLDIRGVDWKIFRDINFVDHNYQKFDASKWPLTPSGLLGPVRLIPMKKVKPL